MPLVPRPPWEPLEIPPGPDPATLTEFQVLAAGDTAQLERATDQAGLDVAWLDEARSTSETAVNVLGLDTAAGAIELDAMGKETACDPTDAKLIKAAEQDAELLAASNDAVEAGGELPAAPATAPAALVRLPAAPVS